MKDVVWERDGDELRLVYDIRDHFVLSDPDASVERLLELLREGGRTLEQLAGVLAAEGLAAPVEDIAAAVAVFDSYGLLEDGTRLGQLDRHQRERYFSNLAFFEPFGTLGHSREDMQVALRGAHVLVLGTGGLNSNTLPHLCGLGVGRLTLLDRDVVEPRNFARQYLYRAADIGARKVTVAADWVRGFDPTIKVEALDSAVEGPERIGELLAELAPDVVMSGIDHPYQVDDWVNDGCVAARVPYVRGGMYVTQGVVWSVEPGVSACRTCARTRGAEPAGGSPPPSLYGRKRQVNRGIGPVAGLLGALCAFEVLRYLTRFEPPRHAGRPAVIDFAAGCAIAQEEWSPHPSCPVCRPAGGEVKT